MIKNIKLNKWTLFLLFGLFFSIACQLVYAQHKGARHIAAKDTVTLELPHDAQTSLDANLPHSDRDSDFDPKDWWALTIHYILLGMALTGVIPVITFFIEHNLAGVHAFVNHYGKCEDYCPNVAVIIPAWNEALVLEHTIDILLKIDYPLSALRLYIIDDGSTDDTPELLARKKEEYPENVFHIRKEGGGKGKAHAVNYGLDVALADPWTEAVLLIDADISFKKDALRRMARHLKDPEVGAVTAYIKVGNRSTNYITRTIGYEYIVSQSIARRAQNVMGVIACLAGGAQLHTRANIESLGGHIDTSTLAEDTYTTLSTQKMDKKVIYEGNAFVYAEEPTAIIDVWKQRFRWARGNLQITKAFRSVWFRGKSSRLGSYLFGLIWFCVVLTPVMMIVSSIGLVGLYFLDKNHSTQVFFYLISVSLFVYLYTTIFAIISDKRTSRLSWKEGIVYPGLISLSILLFSINPHFFFNAINVIFDLKNADFLDDYILLFMESWAGLCMLFAWMVFRLEYMGVSTKITNFLLIIVGYGPFLCTINLAAYIAEIKRPNLRWDKTEKVTSKRIIRNHHQPEKPFDFNKALERDIQREYKFFCREIMSLVLVALFFILLNRL
ncbi:glycosyltransferase family 2 protein [Legionella shakespearei]|uniref:glycosyltransferase family 2 protein n=1 Tax=Legionella shakespearei TaxID=45075 RepID=UPI0003A3E8C6|nr:glycosyltransferase [Legionella shakespearei]